ncbi:MAG: pilus assembly PilX N-terminal domain-containing protein [Candidatus Adiutrix sp.]|jgi:hypothetical protein|nr:pilus assembly PilX N-terminal domain-containing protein [Candidatus Adiutrix sp.]
MQMEKTYDGDRHPQGMILMMTLVILLLMSLMGMAILSNTRTEMTISANTAGGRDAFTRADTAARIATLMARLAVHEHELGSPSKVMSGGPLEIDFNMPGYVNHNPNLAPFDMATLLSESAEVFDYQRRYLATANRVDAATAADQPKLLPHMVFRQDGKVVATARVSLDYNESIDASGGGSLGTRNYGDDGGGTQVRAVLAVTVHGRPPSDDDNYGAYTGTADPDEEEMVINDVPHSIITTMFREML